MEMLYADLDAALALEPEHLSYYGLTYEPNTAMTQRLKMGQFTPAEEDLEKVMYETLLDRLDRAGFEQYEVSNWARRGAADRRCRHNLGYWTNRNWIGVGPSAASHIDGRRWKNKAHLGQYLESVGAPPIVDFEHLEQSRSVGEELMLRLRLSEGVERRWLDEHLPASDARWRTIDEMVQIGMLRFAGGRLTLTRRGLLVADAVIGKLL
jgi:oxygen-independent coproporphyrinogen III oxidase